MISAFVRYSHTDVAITDEGVCSVMNVGYVNLVAARETLITARRLEAE